MAATSVNKKLAKKPVKKKVVVRVGVNKKSVNKTWRSRWQTLIFVLAFAAAGSVLYALTHASTAPNCSLLQSQKRSMQVCVNIQSGTNNLSATVDYTGTSSLDTLSSATVKLNQCNPNTLACTLSAASTTITKPPFLSSQKDSTMITPMVSFSSASVYQACVSFRATSGWNQASDTCTQIITFGKGWQDGAKVYAKPVAPPKTPAITTLTPSPVTPPTASSQPCNEAPIAKSTGGTWACSFDEEFSGTSLNRAVWSPQQTATSAYTTGPVGTQACYMDSSNNVSVSGGYLNLTVRKEDAPFACYGLAGNNTTSYTAGSVSTVYNFSQQNGRYEVRAKLPASTVKGLQETLWLWPENYSTSAAANGPWPGSGEMDFGEFYSSNANYNIPKIHYNYNLATTNPSTSTNVTTENPSGNTEGLNCKIDNSQFNNYIFTWAPGRLEVDINGSPCLIDNYVSATGNAAPFNQPFFVALTSALGVNQGPNADDAFVPGVTPLPATTQVDYVRVWK